MTQFLYHYALTDGAFALWQGPYNSRRQAVREGHRHAEGQAFYVQASVVLGKAAWMPAGVERIEPEEQR